MEDQSEKPISNKEFYLSYMNMEKNIRIFTQNNEKNLNEFRNDFKEYVTDDKNEKREIKLDVKNTLVQATKTNGRATALEEWSKDVKKILENHTTEISSLKKDRWWLVGFGGAFAITGWFALNYIVNTALDARNAELDKKITLVVEQILKDNVKEIIYEK